MPGAPDIVAELTAVIGDDAYARLAAALGGSRIYVPRAPDADHILAAAVGLPTARLIAEFFHGQELLIPLGSYQSRRARRAEIVRLAESLSGDEIARRLKISRSTVYDVIKKASGHDPRQASLFD